VANAGIPGSGRITEYTAEQIDRVVDVNLRAPIQMTHELLPGMLDRRRGSLVYVASISAKVATPRTALYNATKFGLRGFALALHEDLEGTGVDATVVNPGMIKGAGMWADAKVDPPPGGGLRTPEQVADGVIAAIEKAPPEIDVAGFVQRLGGWLGGPAPGVVSRVNRAAGADKIAESLAAGQVEKR
jgi:short-subunit dehydrogenase